MPLRWPTLNSHGLSTGTDDYSLVNEAQDLAKPLAVNLNSKELSASLSITCLMTVAFSFSAATTHLDECCWDFIYTLWLRLCCP